MSPAERVWARLPADARQVLEDELSPTDLQSLLLDLARTRADRLTPARVAQRWQSDRFSRPAEADPRRLAAVSAVLWARLPPECVGLALSPVTPLGTSRAVGAADQNRVLSTVRTLEVVSDPTNVLALEVARRRGAGPGPVQLAAQHRVTRHQRFEPPAGQHFDLFALVSGDRDRGDFRTEAALLGAQFAYWTDALDAVVGAERWFVAYTVVDERIRGSLPVQWSDPGRRHREDSLRRQGIGYYRTLAFKIMISASGADQEVGDGGFVDWTAQLRADAKERCLISCVATERLAAAAAEQAAQHVEDAPAPG